MARRGPAPAPICGSPAPRDSNHPGLRCELVGGHVAAFHQAETEAGTMFSWPSRRSTGGIYSFPPVYDPRRTPEGFDSDQAPSNTQVGGDHYSRRQIQPWDIWQEYNLNAFEGAVIKYILRHRDKNGVEDLKKARHTLDKLIEVEEARGGE